MTVKEEKESKETKKRRNKEVNLEDFYKLVNFRSAAEEWSARAHFREYAAGAPNVDVLRVPDDMHAFKRSIARRNSVCALISKGALCCRTPTVQFNLQSPKWAGGRYLVEPMRTSGGRYHKVTTSCV